MNHQDTMGPLEDLIKRLLTNKLDSVVADQSLWPSIQVDALKVHAGRHKRWRIRALAPARLAIVAVVALLIGGLVVAAVQASLLPWVGRVLAPEAAIAEAYEELLSLESVHYKVEGYGSRGLCSTTWDAPLEGLLASGVPEERIPKEFALFVFMTCSGVRWEEEGDYAIADKAFRSRMRAYPERELPEAQKLHQEKERIYTGGQMYERRGGGRWRLTDIEQRWIPFSMEAVGGMPSAGLDALTEVYDEVRRLPDTQVNGTPVAHYSAIRRVPGEPRRWAIPDSSTETVEVWIGKDDNLPRKAVIEHRTRFKVPSTVEELFERAPGPIRDGLILTWGSLEKVVEQTGVVVLDVPEEGIYRWTFYFSDFNQPVHIEPPQ